MDRVLRILAARGGLRQPDLTFHRDDDLARDIGDTCQEIGTIETTLTIPIKEGIRRHVNRSKSELRASCAAACRSVVERHGVVGRICVLQTDVLENDIRLRLSIPNRPRQGGDAAIQ